MGRMWEFGGLILEMDKVHFTVRLSILTTNHDGKSTLLKQSPISVTSQRGFSNNIEVVAENIFRLFVFSLANHVLVHIQ